MHSFIVTEEDLKAATGYARTAHLRKHLDNLGVRYHQGRQGKIWTTYQQLNESFGSEARMMEKNIEFE